MQTAMKSKRLSEKSSPVIKTGSGHMAKQSGAAPVVAGQVSLGGRAGNNTFKVSGGSSKMASQSCAAPAIAGQVSTGGRTCDNMFKVSGGKGRMAGFTGSTPAKPR